jgi:DNA-binding response OmpR family regulator
LIIDKSVPATVEANKSALNRILNNLLHNAGKFTDSGIIELHVRNKRIGEGCPILSFEIIDSGIGIEEENLENIFTHFTKFNSEGYGIGLATAKELAKAMGGCIQVKSRLNVGTKFTVTLPFEVVNFSASKKSIPLSIKALKGKKILIADDDVVYKKYLTTIFNQAESQIMTVNSGEEVLQLIDNQRFDLIILDLSLPGIDGYSTAFDIRNTTNINSDTPIVGMSASEPEREKVTICGMDDVLPKPLNTEGLTLRLKRVLENNKNGLLQKISPKNYQSKLSVANFNFSLKLDSRHLITLYGSDIEHAYLIFETFLTESLPQFLDVFEALEHKKYSDIKLKAHRFKPAFSMVGLTEIEEQLTDLERNIFNYSHDQITKILREIKEKITNFKPIIEMEFEKLRSALNLKAA